MIITKALPLSRSEFYVSVLALCIAYNASMTSGFRTEKRNQIVGGDPKSKHLQGYGIDVIPDSPADAEALIEHAKSMGYDAVNEGDHVHIEFDPKT